MAFVVTSQLLENGPRNVVYKFTGNGDTGENAIKKVDASSSGPLGVVVQGITVYPTTNLRVTDIWWSVASGTTVDMLWEASANVDLFVFSAGFGEWHFKDAASGFQGIVNPKTTGATGSILFTTTVTTSGTYGIVMRMTKGIPQS